MEHTAKKWQSELDPGKRWLRWTSEEGKIKVITCAVCTKFKPKIKLKRNFNESFTVGIRGSALKKDNIKKHRDSNQHTLAMRYDEQPQQLSISNFFKTTIGKSFRKQEEAEFNRITRLVDVAYLLAKREKPFALFEHIVDVEKRHGVDMGNTYLNEKGAASFTECIAKVLHDDLKDSITANSNYYSIFIDGSCDVSNIEMELMYIMFINNGKPTLKFLEIKNMNHGDARTITETIKSALQSFQLDIKAMVGFCSDGASVNMGSRAGVATLLRQDAPWLIVVHCFNHLLELAVKDAFKGTAVESVVEMLNAIYSLYERSAKKLRDLAQIALIMEEQVRKPQKANGTRWVQHKARACKALLTSYASIIAHLENQAADHKVSSTDRAKFRGYLKKLKSPGFLMHLRFLNDILGPLSTLSCSLEAESIDILQAMNNLEHFYDEMQLFVQDVDEHEEDSDVEEPAAKRSRRPAPVLLLANKVEECVRNRLGDLHQNPSLKPMRLLDTGLWPRTKDELKTFGVAEVKAFREHYSELLISQGCKIDELAPEWRKWKLFWLKNLVNRGVSETWQLLLKQYKELYANLVHMVSVMLLVPVSNAIVERGFSTMGRVKTDFRNRLQPSTLDQLMRISLDGPEPPSYDSKRAAERFFNQTKRNPNRQPYKNKTDKSDSSASDSEMSTEEVDIVWTGDVQQEELEGETGAGQAESGEGESGEGEAREGQSAEGVSREGESGEGESREGQSGEGESREGQSGEGESGEGDSGEGESREGLSGKGESRKGQSGEGESEDEERESGNGKEESGQEKYWEGELEEESGEGELEEEDESSDLQILVTDNSDSDEW